MKYRAGIAPPRPRGPKRLSEYQMQYKWKEGLTSSPLIAAEQVRIFDIWNKAFKINVDTLSISCKCFTVLTSKIELC